jgi:hypothetical protein
MEIGENTVEPLSVLPCQLGDGLFDGARIQPEKRLQLAVLTDAVAIFHRWAGVARREERQLFAEVDVWFASDRADEPFAFVTICDSLGIDPAYFRRGLRRWHASGAAMAKRELPLRRDTGSASRRVVLPRLRRVA